MRYKIIVADSKKHAARFPGMDHTIGTVHTIVESECPSGLSNCRNCGDNNIECVVIGDDVHCKQCGVDHGIAPDSILSENGLVLVAEE